MQTAIGNCEFAYSVYTCNPMHYMLYKPYGFISQFVSESRKKKVLGELYAFAPGTMAIGRLDEDSEGLLLLTTDGKESNRIRSKSIEKEYYVQVDGLIDEHAINLLMNGVSISIKGKSYTTLPCKAQLLHHLPPLPERAKQIRSDRHGPTSWVSIVITEGKFRQIRKMTAAVGYPTLRLVRVRIGVLTVGLMQPGDVIELQHIAV